MSHFQRTTAISFLAILMIVGQGFANPPKTRREFARAMSEVTVGMSEKEVLAILGKPDDIQTHSDPGSINTRYFREVWRYGTDGHLTFPTLGYVFIDNRGKATDIRGGAGEPPDAEFLPEDELRSLLRLVDKAPSYSTREYDPRRLIQIVNTLQPLGKDKSLAVLEEYLRVSGGDRGGRDGVFLVLRVLFEVPADTGSMPPMMVGDFVPGIPVGDDRRLPRYPIVIEDDVPLLLARGCNLQGVAERPERHLTYFKEKGQFRKGPLVPTNTPTKLMASAMTKLKWLGDDPEWKLLIGNQILAMIDSVYRGERSEHGFRFWATDNAAADRTWKSIETKISKLDIRWNREQDRYTFKDGSSLPELVRKLYRRNIWKLEGLGGDAELILERSDLKKLHACLSWSGNLPAESPSFELVLFAVKDPMKPLVKWSALNVPAKTETVLSGSSSQAYGLDLDEGLEIQGRLTIGGRERVGPVFRP